MLLHVLSEGVNFKYKEVDICQTELQAATESHSARKQMDLFSEIFDCFLLDSDNL
jgi:hypothetical protein